MTILSYGLLIGTTVLLIVATAWRLRRPLDAAFLIPVAWLALIPIQISIFGPLRGYSGAPAENLYTSIALGNLTFVGLQAFLGSNYFKRLSAAVRARISPGGADVEAEVRQNLAGLWWYVIATVAVGVALVHLWLMPVVPLFELLSGSTDFSRLAADRENAAKLLAVPSIVKYVFAWDSSMVLPILFYAAILFRWRYRAIFIGAFGLMYIMAPLDKFPAVLFVLGAFIAIAVRDGRRPISRVVIAGLFVCLIPAYLISDSAPISLAIHHAIGAPVTSAPAPDTTNAPPSGEVPVTSIAGHRLPTPIANLLDITLRRIASGPADVTYQWFSYFPAVHPFLHGAGWEPWKVLSKGYQNPANMVGLWAYYGKAGYNLTSIAAYTGFLGDGWAEFGYLGVIIACLWLFAFCVVIELMRAFANDRFCLACYVPCLLLLAATAPISGIMAMTFSLGIVLGPVICLAYLLSSRLPMLSIGLRTGPPASTDVAPKALNVHLGE